MSNRAHRARRDTSEPEVIDALEACGWTVWKLAQKGRPDLIIWQHHKAATEIWFVEVKTGKGKLRSTQNWAEQGLRVPVLRTAEQVFSWHKTRVGYGIDGTLQPLSSGRAADTGRTER